MALTVKRIPPHGDLVVTGLFAGNDKELMADIQAPSSMVTRPFLSIALVDKDGHPVGGFLRCEAGVTTHKSGAIGVWRHKKTAFVPLQREGALELKAILDNLWK